MILRHINQPGLCDVTRLAVENLMNNFIEAVVLK